MNLEWKVKLERASRAAMLAGAILLAACLAGAWADRTQFFRSYLFGFLCWIELGLGCLAVAQLHHLTGGHWGRVTRCFFEAGSMTLPWLTILFLPVLAGLEEIYPWARETELARSELIQAKAIYLNKYGFILRMAVYFCVWNGLALGLNYWSRRQEQTRDPAPTRRLRTLSGPGMVAFAVTGAFACVDWVMSLEAEWYSSIFPVIFLIGQILSAIALSIVLLYAFRRVEPLAAIVTEKHFHHLGNLLLAFVLLWTYVSFSQFLIIWSGNLPHKIEWYLHRSAGGWLWLAIGLVLFHFLVPFAVLLFRANKRSAKRLASIAAAILAMRWLEKFWLTAPSFHPGGFTAHWQDAAAFLGVGGIWTALFLRRLSRRPLVAVNDPRFPNNERQD